MKRVVIFGNSGSGKSTLAKELCEAEGYAHLDLDSLAWTPASPPVRMPLDESKHEIDAFVASHQSWVVEGCYSDLGAAPLERRQIMVHAALSSWPSA
jgi:adenylate kinase family enzyme